MRYCKLTNYCHWLIELKLKFSLNTLQSNTLRLQHIEYHSRSMFASKKVGGGGRDIFYKIIILPIWKAMKGERGVKIVHLCKPTFGIDPNKIASSQGNQM